MKYNIFLFFTLLLARSYSAKRLEVYLSFNECITCYSALSSLNTLNNFEKTIIIAREDSSVSKEFFENFEVLSGIKFIYSSSAKIQFSYCKSFSNNLMLDSFPLRLLPEKILQINKLSGNNAGLKIFNLPKNIIFKSDRIDVFISNNYVNIYDYILNKDLLFRLDIDTDSIPEIIEIKGNSFNPNLFLLTGHLDSSFYYSHYKDLKKTGKGFPHIESAFLTDSHLYLLLNFPYVVEMHNDIGIKMEFFLYERNLLTHTRKLSFIRNTAIHNKPNEDYYLDNTRPFFVHNNKLGLSIYNDENPGSLVDILSTWNKNENGKYDFEEISPLSFDKSYFLNNIDSFGLSINKQFYFSNNAKAIIDYRNNKIINLVNLNISNQTYVLDLILEGNVLQILTLEADQIKLIKYDIETNKVINNLNLLLPVTGLESSIKFYDKNTIFFINSNSTKFYLFKY